LATLLSAAISVPIYSAPMPSWYNLFCAILGVAALARHVETNRWPWLLAAGLCGGASILFKVTGVYFVAAGLLYLVYREQLLAENAASMLSGWYRRLTSLGLVAFAALALPFLRSDWPAMNAVHFSLPIAALAGFLLLHERKAAGGASAGRFRTLLAMLVPFCVGAALPMLALVLFYAREGALGDLYHGVVVLPRLRVEGGAFPLPALSSFVIAIPLAGVLASGTTPDSEPRRRLEFVGLGVLAVLLLASNTAVGFNLGFSALRNVLPMLVAVAIGVLVRPESSELSNEHRQLLFLACAAAAMVGLVQYPHAYGIYFFYAAPLVLLTALYVAAMQPSPPWRLLGGVIVFYLAFAVLQLNGPDPHRNVGWRSFTRKFEPLGLERSNLSVPSDEAAVYRELVNLIQAHSSTGSSIFAGPDCPEVYFLAQRKNPSGVMYEFFRPGRLSDAGQVLRWLDEHEVQVVVINALPGFSDPIDPEVVNAIAARFSNHRTLTMSWGPERRQIDRFRVFWR